MLEGMAADPEERPAVEVGAAHDRPEAITRSGDEWPVSELYYVESGEEPPADQTTAAEAGAAPVPPSRRRFPPDVGAGGMLAALGVILALALGTAFLARDDDEPAAAAQATTEQSPTAPVQTTPASPTPSASAEVEVPDVEGMPLAEARRMLEVEGLEVRVTRSQADGPPGEVLGQEPPAGTDVAKGTVVALVAAQAGTGGGQPKPTNTVPGVIGLSTSKAVAAIRDAGLEARVRHVTSSERAGTVVDQSPAGGAEVADGRVVRLDVSRPRAEAVARVEVPDVVGSTASAARSELRAAGLKVTTVPVDSQEPAGTVISQSPRPGSGVREGTRITVRVSTGPAEVPIPDVTGLGEEEARRELERAGFQVTVTDEPTDDPAQDGVVLRQSPAAGGSAEDGAVVTLVVGRLG
jgi:beta-lactam-binding protein with PASTA domain